MRLGIVVNSIDSERAGYTTTRLGQAGDRNYGTLPRGIDLDTVLARANPRGA